MTAVRPLVRKIKDLEAELARVTGSEPNYPEAVRCWRRRACADWNARNREAYGPEEFASNNLESNIAVRQESPSRHFNV
jgi:hypothetical protein